MTIFYVGENIKLRRFTPDHSKPNLHYWRIEPIGDRHGTEEELLSELEIITRSLKQSLEVRKII